MEALKVKVGIYPNISDVRYMAQKNLLIEFWNSNS